MNTTTRASGLATRAARRARRGCTARPGGLWAAPVIVGALAGALLACEASPAADASPGDRGLAEISRVPGLELGVEDEIDGLDAVLDADGTLHLVWREVDRSPSGTGLPALRARYLRCPGIDCEGGGGFDLPWPRPVSPRLVLGAGRLHALDGRRLERWKIAAPDERASTSGRVASEPSLTDPQPLLAADAAPALAFDLTGDEQGFSIAYLARRTEGAPWELYWLRWTPAGPGVPRRLLELPASAIEPAGPRLVTAGARVGILVASNREGRAPIGDGSAGESFRPQAQVVVLASDDGGASWRRAVELRTRQRALGPVSAVELLPTGDGWLAMASAGRLHASFSTSGGASWTPLRPITDRGRAGPVSAAGTALAWIDDRRQKSERRWWKPLGGWPWSDSPEWANNDILLLDARAVRAALRSEGAAEPARVLTPELGYAGELELLQVEEGRILVWTGRRRVGRSRSSAGEPPAIFYRRFSGG